MQRILQKEHIYVRTEWVTDVLGTTTSVADARAKFLFADLAFSSHPRPEFASLDDVSVERAKLAGPCVLQVNEIRDVSGPPAAAAPPAGAAGGDEQAPSDAAIATAAERRAEAAARLAQSLRPRPGRLLKLLLTDGTVSVPAYEHKPLGSLFSSSSRVGVKILVQNVDVVRGIMLLTPDSVRVLGGAIASPRRQVQVDQGSIGGVPPNDNPDPQPDQARTAGESVPDPTAKRAVAAASPPGKQKKRKAQQNGSDDDECIDLT